MKIKVLYFATYKQKTGIGQEELSFDSTIRVKDLKKFIIDKYPQAGFTAGSVLISVNKEYAFDDMEIPDGAEVAIFPPVSGGGKEYPTIARLTEDELDFNQLLSELVMPETGASCMFTGFVRELTKKEEIKITEYLEYEAYEQMALEKIHQVIGEIRERWPKIQGIGIVQRLGRLLPKTPTILIACTAGHRDDGIFDAAYYGINRVKEIVPVWKKEVSPDRSYWVEGHYIPKAGE